MSLRWRWALSVGLVAALAIGLITVAAILSAERQLRGAVDADLRERAEILERWTGSLLTEDRGQLRRLLPRVVEFDAVVQAFGTGGSPVFRIGPEEVIPPIEADDLSVLEGELKEVVRDVMIGDASYRMITLGSLKASYGLGYPVAFQIATDQSRVDANLAALARGLVRIGAVGVLLVAFTGWLLASRAVRPITDLTHAAERIATTERLDAAGRLDESSPGEIGRLAGAFSSMLASLTASRQQQQRLVSDAGHEFRTPITALRTNLEILRRQGGRLAETQRADLIDAALAESNRLGDLSNELVDLASDIRHGSEEPTEVDLFGLASQVAGRYRQMGFENIAVMGDGAKVTARELQLERALGNLVDNATKWATSQVEIVVDGRRVMVRDDGPGIPAADLPHIFGRFYRSHQARSTPGSGLGLAIVDHLVSANGGQVFAANSPEGGAEVGFELQE